MKKFLFNYFLFLVAFFSIFASGFVDSQDGLQYLAIARRIYYDHTIAMPEANYENRTNIHFNTLKAKNGKSYAPTGIGYSIALLPAVVAEDIFLKIAGEEPIGAFPLENDWPVLLFASMTNSFFGAIFITALYYYLRLLAINHRNSLFLSFFLSIGTGIFVYSKHTFAHMMFVSFMFLSYLFIKKYSLSKSRLLLLISGISFGVALTSYNSTYMFLLPSLGLYYLLLNAKNLREFIKQIKTHLLAGAIFILGVLPFFVMNYIITSINKSAFVIHQLGSTLSWLKPYVFVEGFWGILFSPGKSLYLYAPILVIILLFWHKLSYKRYYPEIISTIVLFLTYLYFIGTYMGKEDFLIWHGDSSFGNRYMLATIPLQLILISLIFVKLKKLTKYAVFYPLLVISICVQVIGISQPYQIKFAGLQTDVTLNGRNFNVYEYGNIIPRYSPLLSLSKKFVRKIIDSKRLIDGEENQIKFYDGFGYPFGSGVNFWRSVEEKSLLVVPKNKIVSLRIVNHQISQQSTFSASLNIASGSESFNKILLPGETSTIDVKSLSDKLYFSKSFVGTSSASIPESQVVFITQAWVDGKLQNLNTIDYPYVSKISKKLLNLDYYYWGGSQNDPWSIWHMHSGVYEKTFDFWWLRPFHYWDYPKQLFLVMFSVNIYLIIWFGYSVFNSKID